MQKHIKILFSLVAAVLLSACSYDDLPWDGIRNTEEYIALSFTTEDDYVVETATRGVVTEPSYSVDQIDLIVFTGGSFKYHKTYYKNTDFTADGQWVKVPRSSVDDGNWYLVANAGSKVSDFAEESKGDQRSEQNFKTTVLASKEEILTPETGKKSMLYACKKGFTVPDVNTQAQSAVFNLTRLYAKITLKVAPECKNFLVKGTRFYAEDSKVSLAGEPGKEMELVGTLFGPTSANSTTTSDQTHLTADGEKTIEFYVLPMATGMSTTNSGAFKYAGPRILLAGRRVAQRDEEDNILSLDDMDTYYAYEFPKAIRPGYEYILTLESIQGQGKSSAADAFDDPVGAVIKFEEKTPGINNIITDGERALASPDSVTYKAGDKDEEVEFTVYWRGNESDEITFPTDNFKTDSIPSWIQNVVLTPSTNIASTAEESGKSLLRKKTTVKFTIQQNQGSERQFIMPLCFKNKRELRVETVITQNGANINVANFLEIKLKIDRGSSPEQETTYYWNTANTGFLSKVIGVGPDDNGGRVRNAGIHLPMPNSETGVPVTYTYTITYAQADQKGNWVLDSKPQGLPVTENTTSKTWTIVVKDTEYNLNPNMAQYEVYKDGLKFRNTSTGQMINLDVYHTGFFSKSGSSWYYYEVFNAGGTYWLDRNVGATSAGMAHLTNGSHISGTWPINTTSAGNYVTYAAASKAAAQNTVCPKGYRLPSQGDFEKLAMQRTFSSDRFQAGANTIFVPNYRLTYNVFRDGRSTPTTVAMYFPHNQYKKGSDVSGDDGAGYYLTNTGTDSEGYYRVMKFIGMNTTATNLDFGVSKDSRSASLRCVSVHGDRADNSTFNYSCQVKGYTHVFLYHVAKDGTKTFLNTWPGQEVAIGDMATKRYNPFTYTSYTSLTDNDGKLFVIFNKVEDGVITESNIVRKYRDDRQGIPFMNGDAYDINKVNSNKLVYKVKGEDIVEKGNWIKNSGGNESKIYEYRIWGSLSGANDAWDDLGKLTANSDGTYSISDLNFSSSGKFVVSQRVTVNGSQGAWTDSWGKAQTTSTYVTLGTAMNLYSNGSNDYDFRFNSETAGKVTITVKPSSTHVSAGSTVTVTRPSTPTTDYKYYINGNIWSSGNTWSYKTTGWTQEANGDFAYRNVTVYDGEFGVGKFESTKTTISATNQDGWLSAPSSGDEYKATPGNSVGSSKTVSLQSSDNKNIELSAGTYDIVIKSDGSSVTVTRKVAVTTPDYSGYYLNVIGEFNNWQDNGVKLDSSGKAKLTGLHIGKTKFRIKIWNGSATENYSTGNTVSQNSWVLLSSNSTSMTISGAGEDDAFDVEWDQAAQKVKITKNGTFEHYYIIYFPYNTGVYPFWPTHCYIEDHAEMYAAPGKKYDYQYSDDTKVFFYFPKSVVGAKSSFESYEVKGNTNNGNWAGYKKKIGEMTSKNYDDLPDNVKNDLKGKGVEYGDILGIYYHSW